MSACIPRAAGKVLVVPSEELQATLKSFVGRRYGAIPSWDPVNQPMIRQWCEALGNDNPLYLDPEFARQSVHGGAVAPPAMLNVWLMSGVAGRRPPGTPPDDPIDIFQLLTKAGYGGIIATNCEQEYVRYVRPGERLTQAVAVESISEEKQTSLGIGYFVTHRRTYHADKGDVVGVMLFRTFCYKPKVLAEDVPPPQPGISQDTQFFWDGLAQSRLLIQRCTACGTLRHPPGPVCAQCHSFAWDTVESSGRGEIYSFVVMHHPRTPGLPYPHLIALVALQEGTRLVALLTDIDAADIAIGRAVEVVFDSRGDGTHRLPMFRPV